MKKHLLQSLIATGLFAASNMALATPQELGALFQFQGTGASTGISGSIFDGDIHSGVWRDVHASPSNIGGSPLMSDSYVLQGGDPFGGDTYDGFETTQAHGYATVLGFAIETGYDYGQPGTQVGNWIGGNPDTGWLKFTNTTADTFSGVLTLSGHAYGGIYGPEQIFSNSGFVTLGVGDSAYIVLNDESSNYGGYNRPDVCGDCGGVSPVPEPESYAMILAGLGLLGFAARRRKQKETAAA